MNRQMDRRPGMLSGTFTLFFESEKAGGFLLIACTVISLAAANSPAGPDYVRFWQGEIGGMSLAHWINDALMAVFFLLIGLELERELYVGELSDLNSALLPAVAAAGGMLGGIGFTMAIFIADLAFPVSPETIVGSKISIMLASLAAGTCGFLRLRLGCRSGRPAKV
jgi:Na+/H+ antiporter NhaA